MLLQIKNMVSLRCKMFITAICNKLGLVHKLVQLGEVEVKSLSVDQKQQFKSALQHSGLELIDNKRTTLVERIKATVIYMIRSECSIKKKNSYYISAALHHSYGYLAKQFMEETGSTIEQYIIEHKIERAKELLQYDEETLTEIAYQLNYSSVAHLSHQFKKVTGMTPTMYKTMRHKNRKMLHDI